MLTSFLQRPLVRLTKFSKRFVTTYLVQFRYTGIDKEEPVTVFPANSQKITELWLNDDLKIRETLKVYPVVYKQRLSPQEIQKIVDLYEIKNFSSLWTPYRHKTFKI